jgi:hypothetical protein
MGVFHPVTIIPSALGGVYPVVIATMAHASKPLLLRGDMF